MDRVSRSVKALGLLLGVLLMLPGALAAPANGTLHVAGPMKLQAASAHDASGIAIFCGATSGVLSFELRIPRLHVDLFQVNYTSVALPGIDRARVNESSRHDSYDLTNVVGSMAGGPAVGWLGVDVAAEGRLLASATPGASLVLDDGSTIGTGPTGSRAGSPVYTRQIDHGLGVDSIESWSYAGAGVMKMEGLTLDLRAAENESTLQTGDVWGGMTAGAESEQWAVLTFPAGTLKLTTALPCIAAVHADEARWSGEATFSGATGSLDVGGKTYDAQGQVDSLTGALTASVAPASGGMDVRVGGDLASASMASGAIVGKAPAPSVLPWILLGALLLTGGGATAIALRRWRALPRELGADECASLAAVAAEAEQFEEALSWNARARAASPTSARLWLDEGYYLEELERHVDALAAYDAAAGLGAVSDAKLCAARLLLKMGDAPTAETRLIEALRASPATLLDAEGPEFAPLARRPRVRAAMDEARRTLDGS